MLRHVKNDWKCKKNMDYQRFFGKRYVECQEGLSQNEITHIEKLYNIFFPMELRKVLEQVLPVSEGFYNWRDFSKKNIQYIMNTIARPKKDFFNNASEVYWNDEWGEEPKDNKEIEKVVRTKLANAPKLIPIYAHRYIPMLEGGTNPIFSIHGLDVICYGKNIDDYFQIEFGEKKQESIEYCKIKKIPFWSEVI